MDVPTANDSRVRCGWCGSDPLYRAYHDEEWGVPLRDERALFELLCLEGQQAGLSWITVLRKRQRYREVFEHFEPQAVAGFGDERLQTILLDPGVIRNRLKIFAIRRNAQALMRLREQQGSFSDFVWSFVDGVPRINQPATLRDVPATSAESDALARALKKCGFTFVGSTICYAFMQAAGLVDDHTGDCWRSAARRL